MKKIEDFRNINETNIIKQYEKVEREHTITYLSDGICHMAYDHLGKHA